jgi:hypothetical protein
MGRGGTWAVACVAMLAFSCSGQAPSTSPSTVLDTHPGNPGDGGSTPPDAGSGPDGGYTPPNPPPPKENTFLGYADGLLEKPIVGFSQDPSGTLWVATRQALYMRQPSARSFRRFTTTDGLHLNGNPVIYCNVAPIITDPTACPVPGQATPQGITDIEAGEANQVFVGYFGQDPVDLGVDWNDPDRHSGKLDIATFTPDRSRPNTNAGTLSVHRVDLAVSGHGGQYWHNRTVLRLLYDRVHHPGELYLGTNHGVDRIQVAKVRDVQAYEYFNSVYAEFLSDHIHPRVCYHMACIDYVEGAGQRMGEWRGLAFNTDGNLWVAGRWAAGLAKWTPVLSDWSSRPGAATYVIAFGDPYVYQSYADAPGYIEEPVFRPPLEGDPVALSSVAVATDGSAWFTSEGHVPGDVSYGVAKWDGHRFTPFDPVRDLGMAEQPVREVVALPDGTLVFSAPNTGLTFYDPVKKTSARYAAAQGGVPDDYIFRVNLTQDTSGDPVLLVATYGGAAILRTWPKP